jgi:hypothetical protein
MLQLWAYTSARKTGSFGSPFINGPIEEKYGARGHTQIDWDIILAEEE